MMRIMVTDQELSVLARDRQDESDFILDKLQLIKILKGYGEVNIVGAKALGLMIAKDIDISVVVEKIDYEEWKRLVGELMTTPEVRKVTAIDYYNYDDENRFISDGGQKYSLYVEMDTLIGKSGSKFDTWTCQIHLIDRTKYLPENVSELKSKLSVENRIRVLRIKYWANEVNKLLVKETEGHFKIQSTAIYPLVLIGKADSIDSFIELYLPTVPQQYRGVVERMMAAVSY